METAANLLCLFLAGILAAIGYGVAVVVQGEVRLTRTRTLRGAAARLAGAAFIAFVLLCWCVLGHLMSALDR